jgi:hypothetical protein
LRDDRIDLVQRPAGLAVAMQRGRTGDHRIQTIGLRRRRIVDDRRAALDQLAGTATVSGAQTGGARFGWARAGMKESMVAASSALAASGEKDRMIGS